MLTRPFYYAIIDEVDSILIDDCRNPLRITSTARLPLWRFPIAAKVGNHTRFVGKAGSSIAHCGRRRTSLPPSVRTSHYSVTQWHVAGHGSDSISL